MLSCRQFKCTKVNLIRTITCHVCDNVVSRSVSRAENKCVTLITAGPHIVAGSTHFDIIIDDDKHTLELDAGMLIVVPQGCWHRFRSDDGVTVLATTPQNDEEHMFVDDPRSL